MSIVRRHRSPDVGSPRDRSDLRAAAGLMPRQFVSRTGGGTDGTAEQLRIARLDGAVIGACRITPEVMRLGESRLKLGVIRSLTVHPQFNSLTVRAALMEDARTFLDDHRYHVALTTGTEVGLRRLGFTAVYQPRAYRLELAASASGERSGLRIRAAKHGDIAAMSRLYSATYADIAGSLLRSRAHMARIWSEYETSCVITDDAGKVLGYFVPRIVDGNLHVVEFALGNTQSVDLKAVLREYADAAECAATVVSGPESLLRQLFGDVQFAASPIAMPGLVACVDTDELFQSMIPEWESLLANPGACTEGELTLLIAGKVHRIRSRRGAITVDNETGGNKIALSSADLANAILGAMDPAALLKRELRVVRSEAGDFFSTLFPRRAPAISPLDLM